MFPLRRLSFAAAALLFLSQPLRAAVPALATALDTPALAWNTGGASAWSAQSGVTADGVDAARATGLSGAESEAWLETTVNAPGFLSWRWRLDAAEDAASNLELYVGDELAPRDALYVSTGWTASQITLDGSGPVTVRWRLHRLVEADSASPDAAYLDQVSYVPFGPPVLQSPADLTARGFTAAWSTVDQALSYAVEWSLTADFAESVLGNPVSAPATSLAVDGLSPATLYYYRVIAYGPDSLSVASTTRSLTTPGITRPANDAFAQAVALAGPTGSVSADTRESTTETDEPAAHQASVWYRWTAPASGLWRFQTTVADDSAPLPYVYTGNTLADLDLVAAGAPGDSAGSAFVEFEASAGVSYRIALDATFSTPAAATLAWQSLALYTPPANDAFASASPLSGLSGSVDATNLHASAEAGETASARHSVWFSWQAPASGTLTLDAAGSAIPATLSVWSGSTLSGLSLLATDSATSPAASRVSLSVTKNVTYRISLDGQNEAQGTLRLAWSLAVPVATQTIAPPAVLDLPVDAPPFEIDATTSSGLPLVFSLLSGPATLSGATLSLTGQPGVIVLRANQAGDDTYLAAELDFQLTVHAPPANDQASAAALFGGAAGQIDADLRYATAEPDEDYPARRSVWYRWTATALGVLTLDSAASATPVTLAVFTQTGQERLPVVSDTRAGVRPHLEVPVTPGATYLVALDTLEEPAGAARLTWSFAAPSLSQSIDFPELSDLDVAAPARLLDASSSSGLPVSFTLVSGPATLSGDSLSLTGQPGVVTLRATQPGDAYYQPAPAIQRSFTVIAPPANDRASDAQVLAGAAGSLNADLRYATADSDDTYPAHRSLWYRWTATATGVLVLDTADSAIPATLAVFTLANGELVAADADTRPGVRPRLELAAAPGTTFVIALDTLEEDAGVARLAWSFTAPSLTQTIDFPAPPDIGVSGGPVYLDAQASSGLPVSYTLVSGPATLDTGRLDLTGQAGKVVVLASQAGDARYLPATDVVASFTVVAPPVNDKAASAARISGASGSATGSNIEATGENGDPFPANHSVWWRWTAPSTGVWTVDTAGGARPVTLTILAGSTPGALQIVASDTRSDAYGRLSVPVYQGATYWIAVDVLGDETGSVRLAWSLAAPSLQQTITFDQALPDLIAGDPAPLLMPTASSGLLVTITVVSGPAQIVDGVLALTDKPGVVTLRASQPGDAYYLAAAPVTRSFKVADTPALSITLSGLRQRYDGTPRAVTALVTPSPRLRELVVTYNGSTEPPVKAGTYSVVATADKTRVAAKLVVEKAPLTVTADDQRKFAGEANPPLTFSCSGFVFGEGPAVLSRQPRAATSAGTSSPGGSYAIKVSGGAAADYSFTYVPGILIVDTFAGRYEALLLDASSLPAGKLEFTVASSGRAFTGRLVLARETAALAFKGKLDLNSALETAGASLVVGAYALDFALALDGRFTANLDLGSATLASATAGRRVFVPPSSPKITWSGAHTAVLAPAPEAPDDAPRASGHATAAIDTKGKLKLVGRLADTTPFTSTLSPDVDGAYRLFALPYAKRANSFLAGGFALVAHPGSGLFAGRRYLPASDEGSLVWRKAPATSDKSYRAGFGPLALPLTLDPWLRPAEAQPLALRFGPEDIDLGDLAAALPSAGLLAPGGTFSVAAPVTTPANQAGFTLKFTPATGAFSGKFTLSDQIAPSLAKPERRTVAFYGVLRTPPESAPETGARLGAGSFLLSPLSDSESTERVSGEIRLEKP